jgi:hypothetical protein
VIGPLNTELIADLARLARRYPPEDWETIVAWLDDESRRSQVTALLREISSLSKQVSAKGKKPKAAKGKEAEKALVERASIETLLEDMRQSEPERADLLSNFRRGLLSRELLPTPNSMRLFADAVGLERPASPRRERNLNQLMRQLTALSLTDLTAALENTSRTSRDLGGEYYQWVEQILRRKPPFGNVE